MKYHAIILQTPPSPPPAVSPNLQEATWATVMLAALSVTGGILTAIGRSCWTWFKEQDNNQNKLTSTLIEANLKERTLLIAAYEQGFKDVHAALAELKAASKESAREIHTNVQRNMQGNAGFFRGVMKEVMLIQASQEAFQRRLDELVGDSRVRRAVKAARDEAE